MAGGEERRAVVVCVYDAIFINPCNWFQHAFKATLRCFGFDSEPPPPPPPAADECLTEPLIMAGSDDHKHNNNNKKEDPGNHYKPFAESRGSGSGSSSSSSSSSGEGDQEQADLQPYTTDDPPSPHTTSDPSVLALGRSRMPPRPPVSSGRGGQTN